MLKLSHISCQRGLYECFSTCSLPPPSGLYFLIGHSEKDQDFGFMKHGVLNIIRRFLMRCWKKVQLQLLMTNTHPQQRKGNKTIY